MLLSECGCKLGWHEENNWSGAVTLSLETDYYMEIIWCSRKSNFRGAIFENAYVYKDLPLLLQNIR